MKSSELAHELLAKQEQRLRREEEEIHGMDNIERIRQFHSAEQYRNIIMED